MLPKHLLILSIFLLASITLIPDAYAEKSKKNTKKADVRKVSREEHQVVKNWESLHNKKVKKRQRIKKQFN